MHVAYPVLLCSLPFSVRSCLPKHSPKNCYTLSNPFPVWLLCGSKSKKDPLRIWLYPQ
ncbi:serine/threonine protein kinase [Salmonella enterica]|nr:serine/threonine protein kinase [Salmonella enterica subsp. enterica serovar Pomona]EAA7440240.1 serine/threonine protein kinase [Salmonella enterica subsp. enterica]EAM6795896.1 serine/threonine protein kinase [Salmonella enterica]EBS0894889.1 serine/threonine protein kinase [Salmonella enterica subsp. enterica serovar Abaetetuba]EBW3899517.1 serine/threonine protein kinase [Salmonella enterica subsp. enterica serovar Panama]EBY4402274.1 serine/threonine protein kinase [Salmonella enterica